MYSNHAGGTPVEDVLFYPWGQNTWKFQGSGGYSFAGMPYYDTTTDTNLTLFRLYSEGLGRWLSPDPVAGDITRPQSLNRYPYVLNSPTTITDLLGLQPPGCPEGMPTNECYGGIPGFWASGAQQYGLYSSPTWNEFTTLTIPVVTESWIPPGEVQASIDGVPVGAQSYPGYWTVVGSGIDLLGSLGATGSSLSRAPWEISWIFPLWPLPPAVGIGPAGGIAFNPTTKIVCASAGIGASVGDNLAVGPLTGKTLRGQQASPTQIDQILSGGSVNVGYNVPVGPVPVGPGGQASLNGSGVVYGPTVGVAGFSTSSTYAGCVSLP
jgi:RHS repeat-associated protein